MRTVGLIKTKTPAKATNKTPNKETKTPAKATNKTPNKETKTPAKGEADEKK